MMTKGTMQIEYEKLVIDKIELQERIKELKVENAKLNIILYHRENGLSHPDFKPEIEISKQAERIKELEDIIKDVCDLINNKGHVSKWKIYNWLEEALEGK